MPNASYLAAYKEALACAPVNVALLESLEISHPSLADTIYIVKNREDLTLTLEDGSNVLFRGVGFKMALPPSGDNGLQELTLTVDNVNREVSDFLNAAKNYKTRVRVTWRPYLSNDLTTPQIDPPLVLFLGNASINIFDATAKASFFDIINKKAPSDLYTRERFPSLGE